MSYVNFSPRDLERVSAYLDHALADREQAEFERRLKAEPDLARAVSELELTRALLRRAPQRRVPRTFSLKADMVSLPQQRGLNIWNSYSFISAAATLVLVLVFAGDIWANGALQFGAAAPAAEEAPQSLMAQETIAEDALLTATPSISAPADAGEIERYAAPEAADLQAKAPFDLRNWLIAYARQLELGLAIAAILAAMAAWWHNRKA
jgi:anti-sigma factor RsiW